MLCIQRPSSALAGGEDRLSQGVGKVNLGWLIESFVCHANGGAKIEPNEHRFYLCSEEIILTVLKDRLKMIVMVR